MKWRILNMADISVCPGVFAPLAGIAEVVSIPPDQTQLIERISEFDGYFCSLYVRTDRRVIEAGRRLRVIVTPSTGRDHIDIEAAQEHGITILSLKEETAFLDSVTATAEMTWALMLAVIRRLPWAFEAAKRGIWARDGYRGHQISGKTLGILGYGRLGRIVAEYGKAFRMRVLACDVRTVSPAPGIEMVGFDRLLEESDVLSLHIHLSEQTRGLIDGGAFAKLKPGAILVNTSRGAIVDERALVAALESGRLAGAGLDVIDGEWNGNLRRHPLIEYANTHENLVISPHIGGVTVESQAMTLSFMVNKLKTHLERQN